MWIRVYGSALLRTTDRTVGLRKTIAKSRRACLPGGGPYLTARHLQAVSPIENQPGSTPRCGKNWQETEAVSNVTRRHLVPSWFPPFGGAMPMIPVCCHGSNGHSWTHCRNRWTGNFRSLQVPFGDRVVGVMAGVDDAVGERSDAY